MAVDLFNRQGYDATSVGDVARKLGLTKSAIYHHVPSKEHLLALALDLPLVPVSSLAALAMQAPDNGAAILAAIDARMGEIYVGSFRRGADGWVEPLDAEWVGPADKLVLPPAERWNVIGTGWSAWRDVLQARLPGTPAWEEGVAYPLAVDVALLALPVARAGRRPPRRQPPDEHSRRATASWASPASGWTVAAKGFLTLPG